MAAHGEAVWDVVGAAAGATEDGVADGATVAGEVRI